MKTKILVLACTLLSVGGLLVAQMAGRNSDSRPAALQGSQTTSSPTGSGSGPSSQPSTSANNTALQARIADAIRNEPPLNDSHIAVNVSDTSIDLTGTVGSIEDKQTAERIAQSFDGNHRLKDELSITGRGRSDLPPDPSAIHNGARGNGPNRP